MKDVVGALKEQHSFDFDWYPHDTLSNIVYLERLLSSESAQLLLEAQPKKLLDIGSQDGELSFLFEWFGYKVTSVDYPATNHNGMRGIRALKELLKSSITIQETDLDSQFSVPERRYGLTLLLGVLYHLKNPFYVLEFLAKRSTYCVLGTRIARCLPNGVPMPLDSPLAYLLDANELNRDNSNYWIFSETGLLRLLKRTRWDVLESFSVGDNAKSDPTSLDRDERAFYLLKSRYGLSNVELIDGWHDVEEAGWRWTWQRFAVRVTFGQTSKPARIAMGLFVPADLIERVGPVTLRASVEGVELHPITFDHGGNHEFIRTIHPEGKQALITFALDKSLPPDQHDLRERGLIVADFDVQ